MTAARSSRATLLAMTPPLLSVDSLAKRYDAGVSGCSARVVALRGVTFAMLPGEAVSLQGAPGAGKTTLLLCAAGLLRADSGTVRWNGRAAIAGRGAPAHFATARRGLHACVSVRETLIFHAMLHDATPHARPLASMAELLDALSLHAILGARVDSLGATERCRIAIAESLILGVRLLLIDDASPATLPTAFFATLLDRGMAALFACAHGRDPAFSTRSIILAGGVIAADSATAPPSRHHEPARVAELVRARR